MNNIRRRLKLLKTKDEVYSTVKKQPLTHSKLILFQVISNHLETPSYGGNLICKDVHKIYGSSLMYYSIQNKVCKEIFNNVNIDNTLKPIYIISNRAYQIMHMIQTNSKKEILEKIKLAFKETLISESSAVGSSGRRRQSEINFSIDQNKNITKNVNNNAFNVRRSSVGGIMMSKPFREKVTKSAEDEYKEVENGLKNLAEKTTIDFAGY